MSFSIKGAVFMRKLKKYKPTAFIAEGSYYDKDAADYAVAFIEALSIRKVHGQVSLLNLSIGRSKLSVIYSVS